MQHPLILLLAGLTSAAATSPQRFLFTLYVLVPHEASDTLTQT